MNGKAVQYRSHLSHAATEHLNVADETEELNLSFHLNLKSYMWLVATALNSRLM